MNRDETSRTPPESSNNLVDLSGVSGSTENPYDALIKASHNDPVEVQDRYHNHRRARNEQQRNKLLDPSFQAVDIDPVLHKLVNPSAYPHFQDPRHCLVFWARPTRAVRELVDTIQRRLRPAVPNLWLMPSECLHMTTLEIMHSVTEGEISELLDTLAAKIEEITDFTHGHRARLLRPMLNYDASAIALSFLPASERDDPALDSSYTYHHLRRDLYNVCTEAGVNVASRYVVPSAHLTIGRFVTQDDFHTSMESNTAFDPKRMMELVDLIHEINAWLEKNFWPKDGHVPIAGEWYVGQEQGLECRRGRLWYGGGERVRLGRGY